MIEKQDVFCRQRFAIISQIGIDIGSDDGAFHGNSAKKALASGIGINFSLHENIGGRFCVTANGTLQKREIAFR